MKFDRILNTLASKIKQHRIHKKTAARLRDYYHSERVRLSRIYGYQMVDADTAEVVPAEGTLIKLVFQRFTEGRTTAEIKIELDCKGMKTRFGNRWSVGMIRHLVRPIYASLIVGTRSQYIKSSVYPALVSKDTYEKAKKAVERMVETRDFDPLTALLGGRD